MSPFRERRLNLAMIETSSEIQDWLKQFGGRERDVAIDLLLRLRFVPRDTFAEWVRRALLAIGPGDVAVYTVRKGNGGDVESVWDLDGRTIGRPGQAQGSEDFVYSIIRQLCRESERFLDNPDLGTLKGKRIRDIVLLDDSIGSGKRVAEFISRMFESKTLMSWWSYGWIKLHVVSYVRSREGEERVKAIVPGSDHPKRMYPKSTKIAFYSEFIYNTRHLQPRWGNRWFDILDLCDKYTQIPKKYRRGYGGVMSNVVFYHSVPNNIPGILFWNSDKSGWRPLLPARTIPEWMSELLEGSSAQSSTSLHKESERKLYLLMGLIKRGIRRRNNLALRMDLDTSHVQDLIEIARSLGFVSEELRPTKAGLDFLLRNNRMNDGLEYDHSLYVPDSWCAGRRTIQPPSSGKADSAESMSADGEVGKASLARTDAMAAPPPMNVVHQEPSMPRKDHDIHGPKGPKEE